MRLEIPLISNVEMNRRAESVVPLVLKDGQIWSIKKPENLYTVAFAWSPELHKIINQDDLTIITKAKTLHRFAYHGFFKPSVAEVLAQLPDTILRRCGKGIPIYFYVQGPEDVHDMNMESEALTAGFHVSKTTFLMLEEDRDRFWNAF